jgi:glucan phosphoethanolaminetransferase (alkaline phosphatase superfamily)
MITTILSIILLAIFTSLGFIHFYWLFGGKWGLEKVIPTKENQTSTLSIPKFATLIVGLVLVLFGLIYLVKSGLINIQVSNWVTIYGYWLIPSIFVLRAIGDFKYVGFFKKIKNTEFAKADSKWFAPLCLTIGIIGILIQLLDN